MVAFTILCAILGGVGGFFLFARIILDKLTIRARELHQKKESLNLRLTQETDPSIVASIEEDLKKVQSEITSHSEDYQDAIKKVKRYALIAMICGLFIGMLIDTSITGTSSRSYRCQFCERTFTDSSNTKSIKKTNMCENCYSNYKGMKKYIDK